MDNIQVTLSPEMYIMQIRLLQSELDKKEEVITTLRAQLSYERSLREELECKLNVSDNTEPLPEKKSRKRRDVTLDTNTYSEFKSNGIRKARAADPIRSYDDFYAIQQYFVEQGKIRDWAMWTIGVSLGLRISDLLSLRFANFLENDKKTFRPRILIYEKKTGKLNDCLITEAVKDAVMRYIKSIKCQFDLDDFLFSSAKTKGKMREECGWRIISNAGKALDLPINIGSHTMRKSFANIAACVDKSCIDMNSITKIQGLLNHSDQRVTMTYLGSYQRMFDRAREAVSDFVLGKTEVNEIIAGNQHTLDDVFERLDQLEKKII